MIMPTLGSSLLLGATACHVRLGGGDAVPHLVNNTGRDDVFDDAEAVHGELPEALGGCYRAAIRRHVQQLTPVKDTVRSGAGDRNSRSRTHEIGNVDGLSTPPR